MFRLRNVEVNLFFVASRDCDVTVILRNRKLDNGPR